MADKGVLIKTDGPLITDIFGHSENIFGGLKNSILLGGNNSLNVAEVFNVLCAASFVIKVAATLNLHLVEEKTYGYRNRKSIGKADSVTALRKDLDAVCKLIIGEDSKVAGQTKIVNGQFDITSAKGTQTATNQTVSILSLLKTLAETTQTIGTETLTIGDKKINVGTATEQVATETKQLGSGTFTTGSFNALANMFTIV
jgi:hypothetical protein